MDLKTLLNHKIEITNRRIIGKEIEILGKKALLLGILQGLYQNEEDEREERSVLYILHKQLPQEEELWNDRWDDEDWDEEIPERTNRQRLLEALDEGCVRSVTELGGIEVNGRLYRAESAAYIGLEDRTYDEIQLIKEFAEQKAIPDSWMEQELELLGLGSYDIESDILREDWDLETTSICAEMKSPDEQFPVGKVMEYHCGHYDPPKEFIIKARNGADIPVAIYGVYLYDIWEKWQENYKDKEELEEYMEELDESFGRDQRLLLVEYSTEPDIQLNFYMKEYLDEPEQIITGRSGEYTVLPETDRSFAVAAEVDEDFSGPVEIELLSYIKFGA